MTLQEQRCLFTMLMARFILWINLLPQHAVAANEVKRETAVADYNSSVGKGISHSLHLDGLAIDLLLYINGIYQTDSTKYKELGEYWKSLHPLNRWGGDFAKPDGNHFSSTRNGIR